MYDRKLADILLYSLSAFGAIAVIGFIIAFIFE